MTIAVIGAGPAGMAAAYCLARGGADVEVYEAAPRVGGLSCSIDLWGQRVDIGPHRFFSSDRRVNELWLEVVGDDYRMVDRQTRIHYGGKFFDYPIEPVNASITLGPRLASACVASYLKERVRPTPQDGTFESWMVGRFGKRLYGMFFRTYSEKLWGIPCTELDADFAAQRIKKLSLFEVLKNSLQPPGRTRHKTLVDRFAYPCAGTGIVYERMADAVRQRGGRIYLGEPVQRVLIENGRARGLELETGGTREFSHVVSSMPLTLLVDRMADTPEPVRKAAQQLCFRNTLIVYLEVDDSNLFDDQWLYIHSPDVRTGRITNFRNWVPELYGNADSTILALEYWCNDDDPIWHQAEDELVSEATKDLRALDLIGNAAVLNGRLLKIPRSYPVYRAGYRDCLQPIQDYLSSIEGLSVIGRYGAFKYNNQDHSLLMGMLVADNVLKSAGHDLWSVNTDYETYQENTVITETGLQQAS